MLPEWDFGRDDAKRRVFFEWSCSTLDHLAGVTTSRFIKADDLPGDWIEVASIEASKRKPPHRPVEGDAFRSLTGMDAALWDYMLLKYVFARAWPGKRRRMTDAAHSSQIAARRNRAELHQIIPEHDDRTDADLAREIHIAWRRWDDVPGRRMATADIKYLDGKPDHILWR